MKNKQRNFVGKHVLITGAASGIGRETAFSFAEEGAALELADIDSKGLERTALLARRLGAEVHTHVVDVSSADDMSRFAARVHERVPAIDVLVNNAGVAVAGSFVGTELSVWDWAISVNLKGVVHGCHFFLPKMIERGAGGHVVNMASLAGIVAQNRMAVYAATKFAVVGLSESLHAELAPAGIGVTTVCPGLIDTPITRNSRLTGDLSTRSDYREATAKLFHKRNYSPKRVADAIVRAAQTSGGLLPVSPESWAIYYGKRVSPRLVEMLLSIEPVPATPAAS
jgi:NAD(P)-dependent dehydrogenase (short-subunit alcohol dehydrogenase family)